MLHGGAIVARALVKDGVELIFTLPGAHVQAIYDGCIDAELPVVDVRHEQTAGYAAGAWGRVTGKPGVAVVEAGSGVTGVLSALANARAAGAPMVVLAGAPSSGERSLGASTELDQVGLARPLVKWAARVDDTARIEEYIRTALRTASTGVPGPVFVELPLSTLTNALPEDRLSRTSRPPTWHPPAADSSAIEEAARLLTHARRPVFVVGSQLRWSRDPEALGRLLERFAAPVFLDGMARGVLNPGHRCTFGLSRAHALGNADVLVLVGKNSPVHLAPPGDQDRKSGPVPRVIQIDLDPARIGQETTVDVGIASDAGLALAALANVLPESDTGAWLETMREREDELLDTQRTAQRSSASPPVALRVCAEVARYVDDDTIVVGDGGDFVAAASRSIQVRWPGMWLDPGPLRTLGVGAGFAIGAKLARPTAKVIVLMGDGAFGMHAMEWEAMARHDIRVVGVVGNDAGYAGMRRSSRERFGDGREVVTALSRVPVERVADACGARGFSAETPEQLGRVLEQAFACEHPALVNVKLGTERTDPDSNPPSH